MKKRVPNDKMLTLRLPESIYAKLDYLADQNWCSVSAVIRNRIRKELNANEELFTDEYMKSQQHHMPAY